MNRETFRRLLIFAGVGVFVVIAVAYFLGPTV